MRSVGLLGIVAIFACEPGGAPMRATEAPFAKQRALPAPRLSASAVPKDAAPVERRTREYALRALGTQPPKALGTAVAVPKLGWRASSGADCERPATVHGFLDGEPVFGTFGLRGDRVRLELVSIRSGSRMTFRGRSEGRVRGKPNYDVETRKGRIEKDGGGEPLNVEIFLPGSSEDGPLELPWPRKPGAAPAVGVFPGPRMGSVTVTRNRLKIEGRDEKHSDTAALELWEVAGDAAKRLEPYRTALRTAAEIGAIAKTKDGVTVLVYAEAGSRRISLAELGGSPISVKHFIATGLVGEPGDENTARLAVYELGDATLGVLVTLDGRGSRGQGNFHTAQAELWILTRRGFTRGAKLPLAAGSDTAHGSVRGRTVLHWVDGDGDGPPEVLAFHRDSSDGTLAGSERYPGWDRKNY